MEKKKKMKIFSSAISMVSTVVNCLNCLIDKIVKTVGWPIERGTQLTLQVARICSL